MFKLDVNAQWGQIADTEDAVIAGILAASKCDLSAPGNACTFFVVAPGGSAAMREYGQVTTNSETVIQLVQEGIKARLGALYVGSIPEVPMSGVYDCATAQHAQLWARWMYASTAAIKTVEAADAYVVGADDVVYLLQDSITFQTMIMQSRGLPEGFVADAAYIPIVAGKAFGGAFASPPVPCGTTVVTGSDEGNGALPGLVDVNALPQKQGGMSGWTMAAIGVGVVAAGGAAYALLRK